MDLPQPNAHITIRHVRETDLEAMAEILNSRPVNLGSQRLPYHPMSVVADWIADVPGRYKIVAEIDGRVAGYGELETWPDRPRLNHGGEIDLVATHPDFRGRGVGPALMEALIALADNWLRLTRLQLYVWDGNERAIDLYRKCGFEVEGRLKQFVFVDGEYRDAFIMARLKPARNGGKTSTT